ncbi:MAG: hypothetical protein RLY70_4684 [Planctomycetota bacterium]
MWYLANVPSNVDSLEPIFGAGAGSAGVETRADWVGFDRLTSAGRPTQFRETGKKTPQVAFSRPN